MNFATANDVIARIQAEFDEECQNVSICISKTKSLEIGLICVLVEIMQDGAKSKSVILVTENITEQTLKSYIKRKIQKIIRSLKCTKKKDNFLNS